MGEWMMIPEAEEMIAERSGRYYFRKHCGTRRYAVSEIPFSLFVQFDTNDIANLNDVEEAGHLWECEIPSTDEGF